MLTGHEFPARTSHLPAFDYTSTGRPPRRSTVAIALTAAAIAGVVAGAGTGSPVVAAVAAALVLACVLLAAVMI
ncbi:hypothetical protein [Rhodococcus opacus]|uniref:hypothetical protein n=1 Tax=Rhodococcus opacus TaxID=37919 RepID=UPI0012DB75C9|nr:hypothetical protein [Rhodococcus opacus]